MQPHRWLPTRLSRAWDSPGKNTGVGCHFLLQCMKMKSESEVALSCSTLIDPMDCSLPGSSVLEIFQARILQWVAIAFFRNGVSSSLNFWKNTPVKPSGPGLLFLGRFFYYSLDFHACDGSVQISYFFLVEFWRAILF